MTAWARHREAGFGLIEVLVALLLLAVGLVSSLAAFDAADKLSYTAQRDEGALAIAQREIERVEALSFAKIGLTRAPTPPPTVADPNDPRDPDAFVSGGDFAILRDYHDRAAGAPAVDGAEVPPEPLVIGGSGAVDPGGPEHPISLPDGDTAIVYRFVTYRTQRCDVPVGLGPMNLLCLNLGAGTSAFKRITVAVRLDPAGDGAGPRRPVYTSSIVADPHAPPADLNGLGG